MTAVRDREAGVTLVEMLVALVIFALVGVACFTTLDTILRVRERTDGRLEHLAQLDRALQIFGRDLVQSDPLAITLEEGILTAIHLNGRSKRRYLRADNELHRESGPRNAEALLVQSLIPRVQEVEFRVLDTERIWHENWPDAANVASP